MAIWQLQEAKARFSELVNAVLKRGPQVISRRGIPTAVLVQEESRYARSITAECGRVRSIGQVS